MGIRGVWSLENVELKKPQGDWVDITNVFVSDAQNVGYTKFYSTNNNDRNEYKLNFSTNTATRTTHTINDLYAQSSVSNPTHAWFIGGYENTPGRFMTQAVKIAYATDTSENKPTAAFTTAREKAGALAGESHSYHFGGNPAGSVTNSKLVYGTDTMSQLPGSPLASSKYNAQSGTNGGADGYIFAGMPTSSYSTTQKITFANDTITSLPSSDMVVTNEGPASIPYAGVGRIQSSTHCYYATGNPGGANFTSSVQKMNFSSQTWSVNPSKCSGEVRHAGGTTVSSTQGAVVGGQAPPNGQCTSSVEMLTFATDSWSTNPSMLVGPASYYTNNQYGNTSTTSYHDSMHTGNPGLPRLNYKSWSDMSPRASFAGYFMGGFTSGQLASTPTPGIMSLCDKLDMSTDTVTALPGSKTPERIKRLYATSTSTGSYYSGHGRPQLYKLTFATETQSTTTATFVGGHAGPTTWYDKAAAGTETVGYFAGGTTSEPIWPGDYNPSNMDSAVQKIIFSQETLANVPSADFSSKVSAQAATGNQTHGYFSGGFVTPGQRTTSIEKITYSTDTRETLDGPESLNNGNGWQAGTGTNTAGYFQGGMGPAVVSYCFKLVYATDTSSGFPAFYNNNTYGGWSPSPGGIMNRGAVSNDNSMYFGGAFNPQPGQPTPGQYRSWIDKFDFTTETRHIRTDLTLTSNRMLGGNSGAGPRRFALVPYDVPVATPTPNTSCGTQPTNNGYAVGGVGPSGATTYKVNMSNDTAAAVPSANTSKKASTSAFNTRTAGWVMGGNPGTLPGGGSAQRRKIPYATETTEISPSWYLGDNVPGFPGPMWGAGAVNNEENGYVFANSDPSPSPQYMPDTVKFNFASETNYALPYSYNRSTTAEITYYSGCSSTSNDTHGYAFGGWGSPNQPGWSTGPGANCMKFQFSSETWQWTGTMSPKKVFTSAIQANNIAYVAGGGPSQPSDTTGISSCDLTSDTWSLIPATIPERSTYGKGHGVTGGSTHSYWMGGVDPADFWTAAPGASSLAHKFVYSTNTWSTISDTVGRRSRFAGIGPRMNQLGNNVGLPVPNVI